MTEIALVGNSNVGKSHIFNRLTGYNRTTGNWDGVSVDIKRAALESSIFSSKKGEKSNHFHAKNEQFHLIDIPGIPSLDINYLEGTDSKIAKDFIDAKKFDFLINVLDANALDKGLHLTLQLIEEGLPFLVVINKCDLVAGRIDYEKLSSRLCGVKVIIVDTISKHGMDALYNYLFALKSYNIKQILEAKYDIQSILKLPKNKDYSNAYNKYKHRADVIRGILKDIIISPPNIKVKNDILDNLFINKYFAMPVFLFVMLVAIFITTNVADIAQIFFDRIEDSIQLLISSNIKNHYLSLALQSINSSIMVVIGLMPPLFMIYLFLSMMEESGYIARVIVVMDGILQKLQLEAKAFIPLILGFGCNVTALLSLKIVESKCDRIKLALALPFINCNARLAIYTMLSIFFFPQYKTLVIFSLYILSILVSFFVLYCAKFIYRKSEKEFLIFELPQYGIPSFKMIIKKANKRVLNFIKGAAGMIITFSFIIMLITNIIMHDKDYAQQLGLKLNRVFIPIGAADDSWQVPYIMISGLVAKEAMIGTISGIMDDQKQLTLSKNWQGHYALLVFIMLYFPCVSVFAVQRKNYGLNIAVTSVILSLLIAYIVSGGIFYLLMLF